MLTQTAQCPLFSENLAIQTFNTLALAYARLSHSDSADRLGYARLAERSYRQAQRVAIQYHDSVWIGITAGNLGGLYADQHRRLAARQFFLIDYRLGVQHGTNRYDPNNTALSVARACWHLRKLDRCL